MLSQIFRQWPVFSTLSLLVSFSLALLMLRFKLSHSFQYLFLVWNLFLAGFPYIISAYLNSREQVGRLEWVIGTCIWLLFLPNAPYIITDFIHIRYTDDALIWLDIILLLAFSLSGLAFYLVSLFTMGRLLMSRLKGKAVAYIIYAAIPFLCGFGIYLGRVMRWNSWDIIQNPGELLGNLAHIFFHPKVHADAWIMTLGFGFFLTISSWVFQQFIFKGKMSIPF